LAEAEAALKHTVALDIQAVVMAVTVWEAQDIITAAMVLVIITVVMPALTLAAADPAHTDKLETAVRAL
jgi:hypothetical protein